MHSLLKFAQQAMRKKIIPAMLGIAAAALVLGGAGTAGASEKSYTSYTELYGYPNTSWYYYQPGYPGQGFTYGSGYYAGSYGYAPGFAYGSYSYNPDSWWQPFHLYDPFKDPSNAYLTRQMFDDPFDPYF